MIMIKRLSWPAALLWLALGGLVLSSHAADSFPLPATSAASRVVVAEGENLLHDYLPDEARVEAVFNPRASCNSRAPRPSPTPGAALSQRTTSSASRFFPHPARCSARARRWWRRWRADFSPPA